MSGKIFTRFGYEAIYGSACCLQILAIVYASLFVKESKDLKAYKQTTTNNSESEETTQDSSEENDTKESNKWLRRFGCTHLAESFNVAFKKRPGGVRHVVIILISLFGLYSFANNGVSSINIQYARKKFTWTDGSDDFNERWAQLQSVGTVFNLFAIGALMPIMTQVLRLRDLSITAICVMSSVMGISTILLAKSFEWLYLANFLRMFSDVVTVGIRSALTKIVGEKDVGKVFACVGAIQAFVGLVSPIYQKIYSATYEWHLGFVYCVSCSLLLLMLTLTLYVFWFMKRNEKRLKRMKLGQDNVDSGKIQTIFKQSYKQTNPL